MTTIALASIQDHVILLNKYCTCSERDIFASNHKNKCGYKQWYDKWEREYLSGRPWLKELEEDGRKSTPSDSDGTKGDGVEKDEEKALP